MKEILFLAMVLSYAYALPAQNPAGSLKERLFQLSEKSWSFVQKHDDAGLRTLATPNVLYVGKEGVLTGQQLAESASACHLSSYTLSAPQLRALSATSAVLIYQAHQKYVCKDEAQPSFLLVTDTFQQREGSWRVAVHTETNLEAKGR